MLGLKLNHVIKEATVCSEVIDPLNPRFHNKLISFIFKQIFDK